jgi:hypothetical protein
VFSKVQYELRTCLVVRVPTSGAHMQHWIYPQSCIWVVVSIRNNSSIKTDTYSTKIYIQMGPMVSTYPLGTSRSSLRKSVDPVLSDKPRMTNERTSTFRRAVLACRRFGYRGPQPHNSLAPQPNVQRMTGGPWITRPLTRCR